MSTSRGKTPPGPEPAVQAPGRPPAVTDLTEEARLLRQTPAYGQHGQGAETLVKHEHFRAVLIAFKKGRHCQEHRAEESLSVQTLTGAVQVHFASDRESIQLPAGSMMALAPGLAHDFEAVEDSTLLLTLAWTGHHGN